MIDSMITNFRYSVELVGVMDSVGRIAYGVPEWHRQPFKNVVGDNPYRVACTAFERLIARRGTVRPVVMSVRCEQVFSAGSDYSATIGYRDSQGALKDCKRVVVRVCKLGKAYGR